MPDIKNIGIIVAARKLVFVNADGSKEDVVINIGTPFEIEQGDYCCPYQLVSQSRNKIWRTVGIDSLQALALTLKTIEGELISWENKYKGKFHFLGKESNHFGF
jgi:hypothetical protein